MKIYKVNDFQIWYSANAHWVCYPVDANGDFIPVTKHTFLHTTHKTKEEAITFAKSKEKSGQIPNRV